MAGARRILSWTSDTQALANVSGPGGEVSGRRTERAWGLVQFGREFFCPWRPLEVTTKGNGWKTLDPNMTWMWEKTLNPKCSWVLKNLKP